jgi:hypothetical protein
LNTGNNDNRLANSKARATWIDIHFGFVAAKVKVNASLTLRWLHND